MVSSVTARRRRTPATQSETRGGRKRAGGCRKNGMPRATSWGQVEEVRGGGKERTKVPAQESG